MSCLKLLVKNMVRLDRKTVRNELTLHSSTKLIQMRWKILDSNNFFSKMYFLKCFRHIYLSPIGQLKPPVLPPYSPFQSLRVFSSIFKQWLNLGTFFVRKEMYYHLTMFNQCASQYVRRFFLINSSKAFKTFICSKCFA